MLTTEFITLMENEGFERDEITKAINCLDKILVNYNITRKDSNVVPYSQNNVNQYFYDTYIACRLFQGYAKGTIQNIKLWLGKFICELNVSVLDVKPMHVRLFLVRHGYKRNGKQMNNSSLEKMRQIISSFYNWLVQEQQITFNPTKNLSSMKTRFKYQGALTSEEIEKMKFACLNTREKLIVSFLLSTGCRIAEFVNIKKSDIDMEQKTAKVLGKGNKERIVCFSAETKLLIEKYYDERKDDCEYLFCSTIGGHNVATNSARSTIEEIYKRIKTSIHLEKLTPHTFRRTFATIALKRGLKLQQVSKLLGHANLQTTMRYLEIEESDLHEQYSRLIA